MAVASGDTTNTDTRDIVATMFTDVNCDPCIRVDGQITINLSNQNREHVHPGDTIDGKFASDFPAASSGTILTMNVAGSTGFDLADPDAADTSRAIMNLFIRGEGSQYLSGEVFVECNPIVEVHGAGRRHIFGTFVSQYLFPGRVSTAVPPDGASAGNSVIDGDVNNVELESYSGTTTGSGDPQISITIRDHTVSGYGSNFVTTFTAGSAMTLMFTFPKGLDANKPCGRDRLAGTAGRLRTRR